MERSHIAAGAAITDHRRLAHRRATRHESADLWIADRSHLGKLDLRGTAEELDALTGGLEPGHARDDGGVWTLRLTATHGYVICGFDRVGELRERIGAAAVDITCAMAAVELGGARVARGVHALVRLGCARAASSPPTAASPAR